MTPDEVIKACEASAALVPTMVWFDADDGVAGPGLEEWSHHIALHDPELCKALWELVKAAEAERCDLNPLTNDALARINDLLEAKGSQ